MRAYTGGTRHGLREIAMKPLSKQSWILLLSLMLSLAFTAPAWNQDAPTTGTEAEDDSESLPPAEPPPPLDARNRTKLARELPKLRNSNLARRMETEEKIITFGRGALPLLLEETSTDHPGKADGLVRCLAELVDVRDRDLVEAALESEQIVAQRFGARAVGKLCLPYLTQQLKPLLSHEADAVKDEAALSLVRCGEPVGLPHLALRWGDEIEERIAEALPGVRGKGNHSSLIDLLKIDPIRNKEEPEAAAMERLGAVEMLGRIGDPAAVKALVKALDDSHNRVQKTAINHLRHILEGSPTFEGAIFQQLREVTRLKEMARSGTYGSDR